MSFGIYDGFTDFFLAILSLILSPLVGYEVEFQDSIRSTLIDSLDLTTIVTFLIINTILLIWFERKVVARMMNRRGPVFIDFNYGHIFGRTWKFGLLQNIAEFLKFMSKEDIVPDFLEPRIDKKGPYEEEVI